RPPARHDELVARAVGEAEGAELVREVKTEPQPIARLAPPPCAPERRAEVDHCARQLERSRGALESRHGLAQPLDSLVVALRAAQRPESQSHRSICAPALGELELFPCETERLVTFTEGDERRRCGRAPPDERGVVHAPLLGELAGPKHVPDGELV